MIHSTNSASVDGSDRVRQLNHHFPQSGGLRLESMAGSNRNEPVICAAGLPVENDMYHHNEYRSPRSPLVHEDGEHREYLDESRNREVSLPLDKSVYGDYQRKDRRFLRWQVLFGQSRDTREFDPRSPQHHEPYFLNKSSQTEAYVVLETDLPIMSPSIVADTTGQSTDECAVVNSTVQQSESSPSSTLPVETISSDSPSLLPPITPCLRGTCHFAEQLRQQDSPVWLGCKHKDGCNYWVHAKCHGFPKMTQKVARMTKGFRCPKHLE